VAAVVLALGVAPVVVGKHQMQVEQESLAQEMTVALESAEKAAAAVALGLPETTATYPMEPVEWVYPPVLQIRRQRLVPVVTVTTTVIPK
jgi:hypothetical protein